MSVLFGYSFVEVRFLSLCQGGVPGTPSYHPPGALAVPGANEDSDRIAEMIKKYHPVCLFSTILASIESVVKK